MWDSSPNMAQGKTQSFPIPIHKSVKLVLFIFGPTVDGTSLTIIQVSPAGQSPKLLWKWHWPFRDQYPKGIGCPKMLSALNKQESAWLRFTADSIPKPCLRASTTRRCNFLLARDACNIFLASSLPLELTFVSRTLSFKVVCICV